MRSYHGEFSLRQPRDGDASTPIGFGLRRTLACVLSYTNHQHERFCDVIRGEVMSGETTEAESEEIDLIEYRRHSEGT